MFGDDEELPAPRAALDVNLDHGNRAAEIFDVDEAGLFTVEGVHHVDDSESVGASPINDFAADREVDRIRDGALDIELARIDLPFIHVEDGPVVVGAAINPVGEVIPSEAFAAEGPLVRELYVYLEEPVEIEPRESTEISLAEGDGSRGWRGWRLRDAVAGGVREIIPDGAYCE